MKNTVNTNEILKESVDTLYRGGILLTHTVIGWGIVFDATNENAVNKAFTLRKSNDSSDTVLLTDNFARCQSYFNDIPDVAWDLAEISVKPLVIILPEAKNISALLTPGDKSIGVLVITDELIKNICVRTRKPLGFLPVDLSADNGSSGTESVTPGIKSGVDFILSSGQPESGKDLNFSVIRFEKGNKFNIVKE